MPPRKPAVQLPLFPELAEDSWQAQLQAGDALIEGMHRAGTYPSPHGTALLPRVTALETSLAHLTRRVDQLYAGLAGLVERIEALEDRWQQQPSRYR